MLKEGRYYSITILRYYDKILRGELGKRVQEPDRWMSNEKKNEGRKKVRRGSYKV